MDFNDADSKEEVYLSWWLDDLLRAGFINNWAYHGRTFNLSDRVQYQVKKELKTKVRVDYRLLLNPHTYTPDFNISWDKSARGVLYQNIESMADLKECPIIAQGDISYIDVKPKAWGRGDSFMALFSVRQKWVFDKHGIYVQPVVVYGCKTGLFERSFTPRRFLRTDISGQQRKINFRAVSLDQLMAPNAPMAPRQKEVEHEFSS